MDRLTVGDKLVSFQYDTKINIDLMPVFRDQNSRIEIQSTPALLNKVFKAVLKHLILNAEQSATETRRCDCERSTGPAAPSLFMEFM